jgi:cysteine desulfurase / selenocysteine lyase
MQLWQKYRSEFPVTGRLVYLNHAAVAPLCRRAAEAMQHLAQDALEYGSEHYAKWMETYHGVRVAAAALINADPAEIAIVKNTSEGIATVATGVSWKRGDVVVAFAEEFPANFYPWKRLEAAGIEVRWLSVFDDLDRIDAACKGARMLAISHVQYLSGYRVDLNAIGEICDRHGTFFLVDAIQGMGAFPIDVRAAKIHALAADGHKWLLGPEGCGVLYVRQDVQDDVQPIEFGWTNVAKYFDYSSRDMALRPDAGRYECGTLNTIGCYGLRASMDFLLEVGIENTAPAIQALGDRLHDGVKALGFDTLGRRTAQTGAGIISFRKEDVDCQLIVRKLRDAGIVTAPRQGWVRAAPHFYIAPEEIDRLLEQLRVF